MSVVDHMGPTSLITTEINEETIDLGAALTLRYSDAPRNVPVKISFSRDEEEMTLTKTMDDEEYERIKKELRPIS